MRFSLWLLLATSALAACSDGAQETKAAKATSLTSKQDVRLRVAHATEEGGDLGGAEKMFLQVVLQSPSSPAAQEELAEFYRRHHADDKAADSLNIALRLDPENADIKRELANIYIGEGEPEKALPLLDSALETNRKNPLLYNSKGVALDEMGNYSEAQRHYKTAYDLDPVGGLTYKINISMSYILAGQYDKAIGLLRPMLDAPDSPPIIRQNLALAFGLKGDNEEASKLGLQDLSNSEVEENMRFYRMLAHKNGGASSVLRPVAVTTVPAADIQDLFPEKQSATAAPAIAVDVKQVPAPPTPSSISDDKKSVPIVPVKPVISEADDDDNDNTPSDAPLKPQLKMLPPRPTMENEKSESAVPAPLSEAISLPEPVLKPDAN